MAQTASKTRDDRSDDEGGVENNDNTESTMTDSRADAKDRQEDLVAGMKAGALDGLAAAVTMVDADLDIYYVNDAAIELARANEDGIASVWSSFDPADLVGQSIEQIHPDPAHLRKRLADPDRLPYRAEVQIGETALGLTFSPLTDADGDEAGFAVTWEILSRDIEAKLASVERGQASIEFDLDGNVLWCNENFTAAMGYSLDEIKGKHHRTFVDPALAAEPAYAEFWQKLGRGEFVEGEFERVTKAGKTVWLRASYNPVFDEDGNPVKFFKLASDITEQKLRSWDLEAKMASVERGQASIEFDLDGNVLWCNENFSAAMGYRLDEIEGKHHRTFVAPALAADRAYSDFWDKLRRGESIDGEFERVNRAGETVWLRASYNPVLDEDGKPIKFFKLASDITEQKMRSWDLEAKMAAVDRGQASIEFDLDGNVVTCNENFSAAMGYSLAEIEGKHHRTFVPPAIAGDQSYNAFWETLNRGQFVEGEFERIDKSGETVWLRASYNPVLGEDGKPIKFFKVASDITEEKHFRDQIETIVARASEVMGSVAGGDLTQTIGGSFDDQSLEQLQNATNASIENLAGLIHQIRNSAASMSSSAKEVATANQDLSRRTEGQASSLEETAASMEEMTATVQQNADNARQASQLAVGAREQAQGGGEVVDRAVGAMSAISESSKKIADIIGVIDEIAFQTNLLALNAAVEAARAGDQGRGFAVVASEVRNLAQRSAGAAKEIKALIQDSLDKVDDGSKLVNQSGEQLSEIVSSVKKVSDIIAEIAAASEEQSAGINQVNQAVTVMDQGTQQNAAMVEQAAAASESMQQQSAALLGLTGQFQVSGFGAPAGYEQAPAAAPMAAAPAPAPAPVETSPVDSSAAAWSEDPAPGDDEAWQEF